MRVPEPHCAQMAGHPFRAASPQSLCRKAAVPTEAGAGEVPPRGDSPSTRMTLESCSTDFPQAACTVTRTSPVSAKRIVTELFRDSKGCGDKQRQGGAGGVPRAVLTTLSLLSENGAPGRAEGPRHPAWTHVLQDCPEPPMWTLRIGTEPQAGPPRRPLSTPQPHSAGPRARLSSSLWGWGVHPSGLAAAFPRTSRTGTRALGVQ